MGTEQKNSVGIIEVVKSVLAAMFGVQSSKNRERDFTKGKPSTYIVIGIIMTVLFVVAVWTVVQVVLDSAGVK